MVSEQCKADKLSEEEQYRLLTQVMDDYKRDPNNLIQILHYSQQIFGYIPLETQRFIAREMDIPVSEISGVVTFYSFFSTKPRGEYMISVCLGTACYVRGGKKVLEKIRELLSVDVGDTTPDMKFSLQITRCIGACGLAPVISVNDKVYKQVNTNKLQQILGKYT